jgi:cytochrome c5
LFNYLMTMQARPVAIAILLLVTGINTAAVHAQVSAGNAGAATGSTHRNLLNQYCVTCHNETLKTANVLLDQANIEDVSQNPQLWEKVVTKLTLRAMPPVGFPVRPKENEYNDLLNYLVTELDNQAMKDINPGRSTVHRLNRTEYTNAIRDLLDLQIDGSSFLPADNVEEGFDNIAEALAVSPLLMEQFMFAATRVSRLAIGPADMLPVSETYTVPDGYLQNTRVSDDLPFGSRGGIAIKHYFPMDGEYTLKIRLDRNMEGYIRGMHKQNLLDVRLDHKRVKLFTVGGEVHGRSGPTFTDSQNVDFAGDDDQVGYEHSADKDMEIRISVKAGRRLLGITFLEDEVKETDFAMPELTLTDISAYKGGEPSVLNVIVTGPYDAKGAGDTPSRNRIFSCKPVKADDEACPQQILFRLAHQAYRRPITENEKNSLLRLYRKGSELDGFEGGIELALQSILAGPEFLFRIEQDPPNAVAGKAYPVSDLELASRLSFFLWSSIPDQELLQLAENGKLRDASVLKQQVQRMIADSRFEAVLDNFGTQWLSVRNMDIVAPQAEIYPEFDGELRVAMKKEMQLWFADMVRNDESVLEMLTSDYTFVNERLASHYGIPGIYGDNFRRVALENPLRRGMLGKASLLTVTSFNNRTSPVVRGNWVLENMFGMAPPPPPADAFQPELQLADKSGKVLTMKESMEAHRTNPVCANCHKMMEPIGLALETFDAIGLYRNRYRDANAEVDASGILFDGSPFNDTAGFQKELFKYSDRFVQTVTTKLLTYALGRAVQYYDIPTVRKIVRDSASQQYTWSSIILGIIESSPFQYRRS